MASYNYNSNPNTQSGSGTFGAIAGATDLPDVYSELADIYPNLATSNKQASGDVLSQLQGNLSSSTINAIQDAAARFGISSGMGSTGLSRSLSLRDLGRTVEDEQSKGLTNYNNLLSTISKTQTVSPETQIALSQSNANLAAQANPEDAYTYAQSLFDQYLNKIGSASASTGGSGGVRLLSPAGGSGTSTPFTSTQPTPTASGSVVISQQPWSYKPSEDLYNVTGNDIGGGGNQATGGNYFTGNLDEYLNLFTD